MTALPLRLRNFTPHSLVYLTPNGRFELPSEGVARCMERVVRDGSYDRGGLLPRWRMAYGEVSGLPDPEVRTLFVVSQLVVRACPERSDVVFPIDLNRDSTGTVIGFRGLAQHQEP